MTAFRFRAVRPDGGMVRGRIEASHDAEAAAILSRRGLLPVEVGAITDAPPWPWQRPASADLAIAFRGLASLVHAGVPLPAALDSVHRLLSGRLADAMARVRARVAEGAALGAALEAERSLFPAVTIGLIRAGESGVGLAGGIEAAARELERDAETRGSVAAALAYPVLLLAVGTVSLAAILVVVVPRFAEVLGDVGDTLPPATQLLLAASSGLRRYLSLTMTLLAALIAAAVVVARSHRAALHAWLLALPLVGGLRHGFATVRVARVLSRLLETGTPATVGLDVARRTVGDSAVAARLEAAAARVAQGSPLSRALADERALTPVALSLAAVGDGTGQLASLLARAADIEDVVLRQRLRTAIQLIEPALIVMFAACVAVVALALLQAVYSVRPAAL